MSLGLLAFGALSGPIAAYLAELFVATARYPAALLGYQMGQVLGGGLGSFVSTLLATHRTHSIWK